VVALTGLPIGYSVIVALTGLPIGYSAIVGTFCLIKSISTGTLIPNPLDSSDTATLLISTAVSSNRN